MNAFSDLPIFHIVENNDRQRSIWPDYRKQALPAGWTFTGFSGRREDCLQRIASEHALQPATPVAAVSSVANPDQSGRNRTTALPFPKPTAPLRLFVFPHAGSGASYYHFLARTLKEDSLEVHLIQYPGREMRIKEPPRMQMEAMTRELGGELRPLLAEKPFAFFGHSMGALIAYELTRRLLAEDAVRPRHLFLSGRQAPQIPGPVLNVDSLTDAAFLDAVGRRYNALPAELLAHSEILALILPSLRADFTLMERYVYREMQPMDVGITLLNGTDDPWITAETLGAWQAQSQLAVRQRLFAGGHFYLPEAVAGIRSLLVETLR